MTRALVAAMALVTTCAAHAASTDCLALAEDLAGLPLALEQAGRFGHDVEGRRGCVDEGDEAASGGEGVAHQSLLIRARKRLYGAVCDLRTGLKILGNRVGLR